MDKKRFYTACIVAAVLSIGVFFGLDTFFPFKPEEIKVGDTAELKDVLGGTLNPAKPDGNPTSVGTTEELKGAAPAGAAAAAQPAAAEPAAAETAPETAAAETPAAAPEPAPAAKAEAAPQAAAPAPAAKSEPAPAPKPEAAPAKPKAEPKPAAKAEAEAKPSPAPAPAAAAPAPKAATAAPIKPWWAGDLPGELSVVYAGSAAYKKAIVLMFNGAFDGPDALNQHIKVKDDGGSIPGKWEISSSNKRMATFAVPRAGRYQVVVGSGVADNKGKSLKKPEQGAVDVK